MRRHKGPVKALFPYTCGLRWICVTGSINVVYANYTTHTPHMSHDWLNVYILTTLISVKSAFYNNTVFKPWTWSSNKYKRVINPSKAKYRTKAGPAGNWMCQLTLCWTFYNSGQSDYFTPSAACYSHPIFVFSHPNVNPVYPFTLCVCGTVWRKCEDVFFFFYFFPAYFNTFVLILCFRDKRLVGVTPAILMD